MAAPLEQLVVVCVVLFAVGLVGFVVRRSFVFMLISIDVMLNAAALLFVVGDTRWSGAGGQVMFVFIVSAAAAATAAGLAIVLVLRRYALSLDPDDITLLREPTRVAK